MSDHFQYLAILVACLVVTLPLEFVFRAHVYRRPGRTLRALLWPVVVFVTWDMAASATHVWGYNSPYVLGVWLPARLPIEEVLFFIVVPLCTLLTFESVEHLRRRRRG